MKLSFILFSSYIPPFKSSNDAIWYFLLLARAGGLLDRVLAPSHVDDGSEAAGEEDGKVHGHRVVVGLGEVAHQVTSHVQASMLNAVDTKVTPSSRYLILTIHNNVPLFSSSNAWTLCHCFSILLVDSITAHVEYSNSYLQFYCVVFSRRVLFWDIQMEPKSSDQKLKISIILVTLHEWWEMIILLQIAIRSTQKGW